MKFFRLLEAGEIECRISQAKQNGVSILLYKTARTDADILDETVGTAYWENDFKLVDGVLYGGIGVDYSRTGERFIWKWDAGTESNTEAEKGRASDAFKRAGFKHGIGRELYSAPFIWIPANLCKSLKKNDAGRWQCWDRFYVSRIDYSPSERISELEIVDDRGNVVYTMNTTETAPICDDCKCEITAAGDATLADVLQIGRTRYGMKLCASCIKRRTMEAKKQQAKAALDGN